MPGRPCLWCCLSALAAQVTSHLLLCAHPCSTHPLQFVPFAVGQLFRKSPYYLLRVCTGGLVLMLVLLLIINARVGVERTRHLEKVALAKSRARSLRAISSTSTTPRASDRRQAAAASATVV